MQEKQPLNLWINQYSEVVGAAFQAAEGAQIEAPSGPSFSVCVALRGRLLTNDGDPMSIADLPKTIKAAEAERVRF